MGLQLGLKTKRKIEVASESWENICIFIKQEILFKIKYLHGNNQLNWSLFKDTYRYTSKYHC